MQGILDNEQRTRRQVAAAILLLVSAALLALSTVPTQAHAASKAAKSSNARNSAKIWGWSSTSRSWSQSTGVLPAGVVRRGPTTTLTRGQFLNALLRVEEMRASQYSGSSMPRRLLDSRRAAPALPDARAGSARARAIANGWLPKRGGKFAPRAQITADEAALATAAMLGMRSDVVQLSRRLRSELPGQRAGSQAAAAHALVRTMGLRYNVDAPYDQYELGPRDAVNVAHGAYMLHIAATGVASWKLDEARRLASTFSLPELGPNQLLVLGTAVRQLGQPYVWAGETENWQPEGKGGFDCSGFAIRTINDGGVSSSQLARINERTSYDQSSIARRLRISQSDLQPGDAMFFGDRGTRSKPAENYHAGVYMGNGWFIHSSGGNGGVAINSLDGYWAEHFSWGRRALRAS